MDTIGDTLRRERLRRGLRLEQVSARTKIALHHLQAMEENRFDQLPGGLFTRSFLRQYTHALDLNQEEIIVSLKQQFEEPPAPIREPQPRYKLLHLPHLPNLALLVIAILACGGTYTVWENVRRSSFETNAVVAHPPVRGRPALLDPRAAAASAEPMQRESRPVEERLPVPPSSDGFQSGIDTLHVVFAATEPVWLSINSDGIHAYSGTIEGLQSREFDASTKMAILVGNAGGLTISVNGKPVALTGAHGEVRSLVVTPEGVQVGARTRPTTLAMPGDHTPPIE
jgi:hypothetical protein